MITQNVITTRLAQPQNLHCMKSALGMCDTIICGQFISMTLCFCLESLKTQTHLAWNTSIQHCSIQLCPVYWLFLGYSLLVKPKSKYLDLTAHPFCHTNISTVHIDLLPWVNISS